MLELEQDERQAGGGDAPPGPGILLVSPVLSGNVTAVSIKLQITQN